MSDFPFTGGEWTIPHFAREDVNCNCRYVYGEQQFGMGAICEVYHQDGTDENAEEEPREIAEANARLISVSPRMFKLLYSLYRGNSVEVLEDEIRDILEIVLDTAIDD